MNRDLAESIVKHLSFCPGPDQQIEVLESFGDGEWKRNLAWIHDSGLALYFLRKLEATSTTDALPTWVLESLHRALDANRERTAYLASQFQAINEAFDTAGVNYAVVKGFSLVPDFCSDISLRPLGDLDYIVSRESLHSARKVVERNGYSLRSETETEFKFFPAPPYIQDQYSVRGEHSVELHVSLWNPKLHETPLFEPRLDIANIVRHPWQRTSFPAFSTEDSLLLQAVHAFHHVLTYWIRLSCFYEIAVFLDRYIDDELLWSRVEERVGSDANSLEVLSFAVQFASLLFGCRLPPIFSEWMRNIRPSVAVWIENYARTWALGRNHPGDLELFSPAKVVLFLHQQYLPRTNRLVWKRLFPTRRISTISESVLANPFALRDSDWRRRQLVIRRSVFHMSSGLRYLWEIPRWRRLNQIHSQ